MRRNLAWYKPTDPWLFLIPTIIGLVVFRLGPIINAFMLSFTDWNLLKKARFIGFDNYIELLTNPDTIQVLRNTFFFSLLYVIGVLVCSLFLAAILNNPIRGVFFFRAAFYTPVVTSAVAVGVVWIWILSTRYGLVAQFFKILPFDIVPPAWFSAERALGTIVFIQVWKMMGYYMIIYLAGMKNIPHSLVEAAEIDGANRIQRFFRIILPLLSPTTFFIVIIATIDSFKNFEIIYTLTRGGPQNSTNTLAYDIYLQAFGNTSYRIGYASAIAFILLVIVGIVTLINFHFRKKWVHRQH